MKPDHQVTWLRGSGEETCRADELTPMKAIRRKCYDCSGGSANEVKLCTVTQCPLWPYRLGKRPSFARSMAYKAS